MRLSSGLSLWRSGLVDALDLNELRGRQVLDPLDMGFAVDFLIGKAVLGLELDHRECSNTRLASRPDRDIDGSTGLSAPMMRFADVLL
jgi:hypothetical protein